MRTELISFRDRIWTGHLLSTKHERYDPSSISERKLSRPMYSD